MNDGKKTATIDNRLDLLAEKNEKNTFVKWNNRWRPGEMKFMTL